MTKKKKQPDSKPKKRGYGAKLIWVANNLSEAKLKLVDELAPTPEQLFDFYMACIDNGIDLKLTYDTFSECYTVSAVGGWDNAASAGYACSARSARDVYDAMCILWYKVEMMAEFDLSSLHTEKQEDDMRG